MAKQCDSKEQQEARAGRSRVPIYISSQAGTGRRYPARLCIDWIIPTDPTVYVMAFLGQSCTQEIENVWSSSI